MGSDEERYEGEEFVVWRRTEMRLIEKKEGCEECAEIMEITKE